MRTADRYLEPQDKDEEIRQLRAALWPFAEFADVRGMFNLDAPITQGSGMSKRQLTMGDCYNAAKVLRLRE